ncbi:MAG: hypothetical protein QOE01_1654 [Actinomycetota bacterium]|nr:hypothetical protein [Actinomycetota bacterium]
MTEGVDDPRPDAGAPGSQSHEPGPSESGSYKSGTDESGDAHDHGSLGEEAARLAEAVQEWLRASTAGGGLGGAFAGASRASAARDVWAAATQPSTDGAECSVCPVCALLRLVRHARPEVFEHLSDAAASFTAALRDLAGEAGWRAEAGGSGGRRADGGGRSGVEHIDLG